MPRPNPKEDMPLRDRVKDSPSVWGVRPNINDLVRKRLERDDKYREAGIEPAYRAGARGSISFY